MLVHMEEPIGSVGGETPSLYKIRTGSLCSFIELSKKMAGWVAEDSPQEQLLAQYRLDSCRNSDELTMTVLCVTTKRAWSTVNPSHSQRRAARQVLSGV